MDHLIQSCHLLPVFPEILVVLLALWVQKNLYLPKVRDFQENLEIRCLQYFLLIRWLLKALEGQAVPEIRRVRKFQLLLEGH